MSIRVFYIVTLIWCRVLLYHYSLYMRIQNNSLNYMYDNCVLCSIFCSVRCSMCCSMYSVLCCIIVVSVFCVLFLCVCILCAGCVLYSVLRLYAAYCCIVVLCKYICMQVYYVRMCVSCYLCSVCMSVVFGWGSVELNPIPPYMVTYAGIW